MLCVFIPSEGSVLLSSFDFRATLSRTIFSKKSSRNASHMRTVFLIKESLFDGKVLPRNCHAGQVLRASSSPSPKIENAFFFFRMWRLGRHHWYLHRFTVPRKNVHAHTDVIAQSLKNSAELCYTIRGLCFMLTLNYEKCPQNRCFSAKVQPTHLI